MILDTHQLSENPSRAIIGLHGWTGDEESMRPVAIGTQIKSAKWYFPRAPYAQLDRGGFTWFSGSDEDGWTYQKTFALMSELMTQIQREGFDRNQIYLVGFSQGASLAMEWMVRLPFSIGGIVPMAGFIKYPDQYQTAVVDGNRDTPILLLHGKGDDIVPVEEAEKSMEILHGLGYRVTKKLYRAGHKIPVKANRWIRDFIEGRYDD